MPPKKLIPALLGGLFIGVLSALPFVRFANCCCLWIVSGGYLAAYVMQQEHPFPITAADGAIVGFLSGIIGACVFTIVDIPIGLLMGPLQAQFVGRLSRTSSNVPPELREVFEEAFDSAQSSLMMASILRFVPMFFVGVVFAPVGGILGALFSRRQPLPPASAPPPPPAPPPPTPPSMEDSGTWPSSVP
jgi:thiamine transporter ThiT